MDRRSFVGGTPRLRPPRWPFARACAAETYPIARHHLHQSVPAGRRRRRGRPAARRRAGADRQAAVRDRNQGRRRRRGRRAVRRQRQARRLHAAHPHRLDLRLCRSRQAVRPRSRSSPAPISFRSRGWSPIRCVLLVNDQQPYKTLKELVDDAKKQSRQADLQVVRPLWRAASADRAVHARRPASRCSHLPTNGGGPALTAILGNNSQVLVSSIAAASGADQGRQAARRSRCSAPSARRRCPTCRR